MTRLDAIYARQSADRSDSISIESQIEYCRYETRGSPCRIYFDKGYSGKNTDRPEFQKMLADIRKGEIQRVICYKLDRCSRSILDFTSMLEEFQQYGVSFVSCTEKFDTSTPMGRAMLNICVVFAQLERETIQQRVADAYHSRSQKGFYMGGRIPYGFTLVPHYLEGKKTSRYDICPEEADVLFSLYSQYADPQCSVGDLLEYLHEKNIPNSRTKDGQWRKSTIQNLLKNPIYVRSDLDIYRFFQEQGVHIQNPPEDFIGTNGCYLYTDNGPKRKTLCLEGHSIVLAPHHGIIPSDIWLRCRRKCLSQPPEAKPIKAKNTWLAGKIKCAECGYALIIRKSGRNQGAKRYFMCSRHLNNRYACTGVGCLPADIIEDAILTSLLEALRPFWPPEHFHAAKPEPHTTDLKIQILKAEEEKRQLLSKLPQANESVIEHINQTVSQLNKKIAALTGMLQKSMPHRSPASATASPFPDPAIFWEQLPISGKITVADIFIKAIHGKENSLCIEWKI